MAGVARHDRRRGCEAGFQRENVIVVSVYAIVVYAGSAVGLSAIYRRHGRSETNILLQESREQLPEFPNSVETPHGGSDIFGPIAIIVVEQ